MNLFFRKIGVGEPIVFLHGVFGSSDNLYTVSKEIANAGYSVYLIDARNHGQSPRNEEFNYDVMAADLDTFLIKNDIDKPVIIGHSMGGKTVLKYSQDYTNYSKLIIVDIAAKFYPTHHDHIIAGLNAIDINKLGSRKEAEDIFSNYVSDVGEKQFILKNLYRTETGFDWRINIPVISKNIFLIGEQIVLHKIVEENILLLTGSESGYVSNGDFEEMKAYYPNVSWKIIEAANHWVHATQPQLFIEAVLNFIQPQGDTF